MDPQGLNPLAAPWRVGVVSLPRRRPGSDTEFVNSGVDVLVRWISDATDSGAIDLFVLPDSGDPAGDLAWLRRSGLDGAIAAHAGRGGAVLGLGAGSRLLGEALIDPWDIAGNVPGLGLLPLVTTPAPVAVSAPAAGAPPGATTACVFGTLAGVWAGLSGAALAGEDAWSGHAREGVVQHPALAAAGDVAVVALRGPHGEPLGWRNGAGQVLGLALRGVLRELLREMSSGRRTARTGTLGADAATFRSATPE